MNKDAVLEAVKKDGVKFINLQFTDITGAVKSVTIPVSHLPDSLEKGTWFDGSSIEGFTRINESDMFLKPDPSTYAVIPWIEETHKTARLICDVYTPNGKPFEGDPRFILKRVMAEAKEMGYEYNTGPELEFFLFKKDDGKIAPLPHDAGGYFDLSMDDAYAIRKEMVQAMEQMGITVEASHHEVAQGQHEIDFRYGPAIKTADNAITMKFVLKAIAAKHGLHATFMPKPIAGINGSGMHIHQSLFNIKTGKNTFFDSEDKMKLSGIAKQFIAGQLKNVKSMSAILSPLVNSYKRLVPGYEAPVYICWSQINRSALIRIPRYSEGREQATRCEIRCPDPSCNPYLAFAALLKAGLAGIKEKAALMAAITDSVYDYDESTLTEKKIDTLPSTLSEAIGLLENSHLMLAALGKHTFDAFIRLKKAEWDAFRMHVSDWELNEYLEVM